MRTAYGERLVRIETPVAPWRKKSQHPVDEDSANLSQLWSRSARGRVPALSQGPAETASLSGSCVEKFVSVVMAKGKGRQKKTTVHERSEANITSLYRVHYLSARGLRKQAGEMTMRSGCYVNVYMWGVVRQPATIWQQGQTVRIFWPRLVNESHM